MPDRLKEARLRTVVDTAVDGVILINNRGAVLMFNPACEKLFGYKSDEVIGQNVKILMPPPFRDEHDGYLENYRLTGERKIIGIGREVVGQRKDGSTFPMELSVGEAKEGADSIFVGVIHDLTERKRTEERLMRAQKMETVGNLSGGIAHDFNNLLTVIIGHADSLSEKLKARPDLRQICDTIVNAGQRGAELTRRLLAFSRRQTLQPVAVDCNRLIEDMRHLAARTVRDDIEIRLHLEPGLRPAYADPGQLESAILNLIVNAQDAMPDGGHLTITSTHAVLDSIYRANHPEVSPGEYVLLSVSDDGTGMPPEVLERAFEPFFTTKEVGKGSGLGLSMVYGFAKQSEGHVAIYSEVGLGTTVRLYLPVAGPAPLPAGAIPGEFELPRSRILETILVAEDDPFVRNYAVACVKQLGYRVVTASDGNEALAILEAGGPIDVLFSDVVMSGGISGWELAERARLMRPAIGILLTSGYPKEIFCARAPTQNYPILEKPYRKSELAFRLREILDLTHGDPGPD